MSGSTRKTLAMRPAELGEQRRFLGCSSSYLPSPFFGRPLAAYAVGVVGIEVGAMFAGVGDMVGQTRQHSSGSMASKLRPSEGFMRVDTARPSGRRAPE